jgi:GntR family transcriptional regulator, transcriptional repressor for pyruvate dehydrogenase complex
MAPSASPVSPAAAETTAPTRPPRRTSVTDDAITRIRHMILVGELAPGDRLPPEADLAANLGLSRTSLREAVRALTLLGVIEPRQGDGSYITGLGPELLLGALALAVDLQGEEHMPDLVAVRRILEPAATALAATRATSEELATIRSYIHPELTDEQVNAHVKMDYEFHHAIARASGNPLLAVLLDGLAAPTVRMRVWRGITLPGVLDRTLHEHRAIADALEARDPELAYAAATMHVAAVETWVRGLEPGWSSRAAREVHAESMRGSVFP